MRKMLMVAFVILFSVAGAMAQQVVKGKILDVDGAPIPGASVVVKGQTLGTTTDADGSWSFKLPSGAKTLVFSAVGYAEKIITVTKESVYNVTLGAASKNMDEVVVVAYGTQKKESLTGSVIAVGAKEIEKRPLTNAIAVLEGAAPGIQVNNTVGQPGSSPNIRIRGVTSVNYSSEPLYVIDGVPFGGNPADINPADIESISVLKDAASSALYGSRAASGVILMTTKKGSKSNTSVNFSMNQGFYDRGINEYKKLNANEFMEVMWKGYRNYLRSSNPTTYSTDALAGAKASSSLISDYLKLNIYDKADDALFDANGKLVSDAKIKSGYAGDLDWFNDYERLGQRSDYNLSGRTGSEKNSLYFSLGYLDEKGYIKKSDFKRFAGRINADLQVNKWFKYGFNIGATHQESNSIPATVSSAGSIVNPVSFARNMAPIYPVHLHDVTTGDYIFDASGNKQYDDGTTSRGQNIGRHAIWENELNMDRVYRNTLMGQAYTNISFLKDFVFSLTGDMNARANDNHTYNNAIIGDGSGNNGRAARINYRYLNYTMRESLTWGKNFNDHHVDVMAGHENVHSDFNYLYGYKTNQSFAGATEFANFTSITSLDDYKEVTRYEAYFGRARYNYDDKYYVDASVRRDATSKFFGKWGNFYSVGASWIISKERFFDPLAKTINYLKLRTSYGEVGNESGVNPYAWMALYDLGQNANAAALYKVQNETKNLIWESNASIGAAVEGRIFDRANFSIEYFDRQSKNLIYDVNLPLSAGATSSSSAVSVITQNIGKVSNKGWEFSVDVDIVRTKDFRFNLGANATIMKNKVVKLPAENKNGIISGTKKIMEGHGIYDFWLYQFAGVDQMTGLSLYLPDTSLTIPDAYKVTINGNTYTTYNTYAKRDWSGSAIPDVYGSLTPSVTYKNFSLGSVITYSIGGKVYDYSYASLRNMNGTVNALHKDLLNAWDGVPKDMTATSANRIDPNGIPVNDFYHSDRNNGSSTQFLKDGSYLVIKNINFSYRFPKEMLNRLDMKSLSLGVTVDNLYTATKLQGMNPQQSFGGTSENAFVTPRVLSFVLNVGL